VSEAASSSPRDLARGFVGVTAAAMLGNVFAYVLLLTAARVLHVRDYSAFVALMNLLLVGSVPAFALQAVAARRVATGQVHDLIRVSGGLALGVGLLFLLLTPLEVAFLHLPMPMAAIFLALALPGVAMQGLCQGVWQGHQRFAGLAMTTFAGMLGRSGAALAGLVLGGTATSTLGALAAGVSVTAAVCLLKLPRHARMDSNEQPSGVEEGASLIAESSSLLTESAHAAHAYGVFLLLSVMDLLLASHVLDTRSAAVYAAGSVMTKAALWLPQSVAHVLFASMTDHGRHRDLFLRAAGAIIVLGAAVVAVCALAGGLVSVVVAGNQYPELDSDIWLFAALGACLAVMQFALVSGLAIRSGRVTAIIWLAIAAEVGYVLGVDDQNGVRSIILGVLLLNVVAASASLLLRAGLRPASEAETDSDAAAGRGRAANSGAKPAPS
jgi:hypothetical protein